ncbi:MAG: hypothetical protein Greene101449_80 [Candidatus Peregrinibacteria bacterium Greene1014_49]|nr:MAG: hypothetical protein Greene101449_80 [Candidatus Peregrinibacteria bacterium Greene1014_49]
MKKFAFPVLLTSLTLAACQASVTPELQEVPVEPEPAAAAAFDGEAKTVDMTQSSVSFEGKSSIINHKGSFTTYSANVTLDETDPADLEKASITAAVDLTSVVTDTAAVDGHFQREDFFNTAVYPPQHSLLPRSRHSETISTQSPAT